MMKLPTLGCAQALRDGGIDAMAALDQALSNALEGMPDEFHWEIKLGIGRAMAVIIDETINPAIQAYPELKPSEEAWISIAKTRAFARATQDLADA